MQRSWRYFHSAATGSPSSPTAVIETVRVGNETVLEGRLDDAFTLERDLAAGDRGARRTARLDRLLRGGGDLHRQGRALAEAGGPPRRRRRSLEAARLAKADQAAELVREFPELEGYIGAEYARLAGFPEAVCAAIAEQYLPDSAGGPLSRRPSRAGAAAADKIDTLTVSFSLGHKPTGSRDPFGLRRAAIGLCRLATEGGLTIPDLLTEEVSEFVEERFEGLLRDVPVEFVRAARAANVRDLGSVARLAQALAGLPDERLEPIHTAYVRAGKLGESEEARRSSTRSC